jgi:hypothetical protein
MSNSLSVEESTAVLLPIVSVSSTSKLGDREPVCGQLIPAIVDVVLEFRSTAILLADVDMQT